MKVYIVIELEKDKQPKIIGTYKDKKKAQQVESEGTSWRNTITQEVI